MNDFTPTIAAPNVNDVSLYTDNSMKTDHRKFKGGLSGYNNNSKIVSKTMISGERLVETSQQFNAYADYIVEEQ